MWTDDPSHYGDDMHLWAKGENRSLFVKQSPSEACPHVLPVDVEIQTQRVCRDTGEAQSPSKRVASSRPDF